MPLFDYHSLGVIFYFIFKIIPHLFVEFIDFVLRKFRLLRSANTFWANTKCKCAVDVIGDKLRKEFWNSSRIKVFVVSSTRRVLFIVVLTFFGPTLIEI